MTITMWEPFRTMEQMRRDIDRVFEGLANGSTPVFRAGFLPARSARNYPMLNLSEDKDNYYVNGPAPGLDADSLEISVVDEVLRIEGEKSAIKGDIKREAFHRNERAAGRFVRTIQLPGRIDRDGIKAEYRDGMLWFTLPKAEETKPKVIELKVS